jgi:hypothetical protein
MNDHGTDGSGADGPIDDNAESAKDQDLRATAESIRADSGELARIEDEKLGLEPEDPRVGGLSTRAVELAEQIAVKTRAELQLAEEGG